MSPSSSLGKQTLPAAGLTHANRFAHDHTDASEDIFECLLGGQRESYAADPESREHGGYIHAGTL